MRIIAGSLGGRHFEAPKGHRTHPMSEKIRGGLFAALGDIDGLTVLDAFAGSGALAFEAISRGAESAVAIDIDKSAINTVVNSAQKLDISAKIKAIRANSSGWSDNNPDQKFDLIFCDPPFDQVKTNLLQKLTVHLKESSVFVVNLPGSVKPFELAGMKIVKAKDYGDAQLVFYKKIS